MIIYHQFYTSDILRLSQHVFRHEGSDITKAHISQYVKDIYIYNQLLLSIDNINYQNAKEFIQNKVQYFPHRKQIIKSFEYMAIKEKDLDYFHHIDKIYSQEGIRFCLKYKLNDLSKLFSHLLKTHHKIDEDLINEIIKHKYLISDKLFEDRYIKEQCEDKLICYVKNRNKIDKIKKYDVNFIFTVDNENLSYIYAILIKKLFYQGKITQDIIEKCKNNIDPYLQCLGQYLNSDILTLNDIYTKKKHIKQYEYMNYITYLALKAKLYDQSLLFMLKVTNDFIDNIFSFNFDKETKKFIQDNIDHIKCLRGQVQYRQYPKIISSIIKYESYMNSKKISPLNAIGIMQVRENSYLDFTRELNIKINLIDTINDIETNIKAGCFTLLKKIYFLNRKIDQFIKNRNTMLWIGGLLSYHLGQNKALKEINKYIKNDYFDYMKFLMTSLNIQSTEYIVNILKDSEFDTYENTIEEFCKYLKDIFNNREYSKIKYMINHLVK